MREPDNLRPGEGEPCEYCYGILKERDELRKQVAAFQEDKARLVALLAALQEIVNSDAGRYRTEVNSNYRIGIVDGYKHCATLINAAIDAAKEESE